MRHFKILIVCLLVSFVSSADAHDMNMSMGMHAPATPPSATGRTIGGPFALTDQDGRTVTDKAFPHKKLVYFGYTYCPDACPIDLRKIAQAVQALGPDAAKLDILFITTDPARDTPRALKIYLQAFLPARITGLTGTPAQLAQVEKEYGVYVERVEGKDKSDYMLNHTTFVYLIDSGNKLLDVFDANVTPAALASGIRAKL